MSRTLTQPTRLAPIAAGLALCLIGVEYAISTPDQDALREFLVVTGMIAVATAVVFGLVLPRTRSAGVALTLSLLGLLLSAAFWSGIPPVLAIGGVALGRRGLPAGAARAAVALGLVALAADVVMVILSGVIG